MKYQALLLATVATLALTSPAFAAEEKYETKTTVTKQDNGDYEKKELTTSTDAAGNSESLEQKVEVDVDPKGNVEKTVSTKHVSDPKGLANKHVVEVKDSSKVKDGKLTSTHEKTVDGKNMVGEKDKYKTTTKVVEDTEGNYDEKTKVSKTDAVGTKTTYEKKAKVEIDSDGGIAKSTTTKEVKDPKGLMNKTVVDTSNTQTIEDGLVTSGQEIKVDGKVVDSQKSTTPQ
jgi:hypothetical protein